METKTILDVEFVPCDLHPDKPAVQMEVTDNGKVRFTCEGCR